MTMKSRILAAVGGVGLTLAVAVTAVTAGGPLGGSAAPAASPSGSPVASSTPTTTTTGAGPSRAFSAGGFGMMPGMMTSDVHAFAVGMPDQAQCEDVQSKLAANLGVTTDALEEAIKKTILQEIDEAEKAGKLTAEQATTARDRVKSATDLCAGFGMHVAGSSGQRPEVGGRVHFGMIGGSTYEAVAKYFGITTEQLKQDATDLGTLQAVAAKHGKDNAAGKAGLKTAIEQALKADLAQHGVPQEMIDRIVAEFSTNFDTLYTTKLDEGKPMGPGGPSRRGPRTSPSPSPASTT
jgi:hypothetical protein